MLANIGIINHLKNLFTSGLDIEALASSPKDTAAKAISSFLMRRFTFHNDCIESMQAALSRNNGMYSWASKNNSRSGTKKYAHKSVLIEKSISAWTEANISPQDAAFSDLDRRIFDKDVPKEAVQSGRDNFVSELRERGLYTPSDSSVYQKAVWMADTVILKALDSYTTHGKWPGDLYIGDPSDSDRRDSVLMLDDVLDNRGRGSSEIVRQILSHDGGYAKSWERTGVVPAPFAKYSEFGSALDQKLVETGATRKEAFAKAVDGARQRLAGDTSAQEVSRLRAQFLAPQQEAAPERSR